VPTVATVVPDASTTVAVTVAGAVSLNETWPVSSKPSALGEITAGSAVASVMASADGLAPKVPRAGSTVGPASIEYEYVPCTAAVASQVQSTAVPVPPPPATLFPAESVTVTVQGSGFERYAVKRTGPPRLPRTAGE
jgi:hypothetical protein